MREIVIKRQGSNGDNKDPVSAALLYQISNYSIIFGCHMGRLMLKEVHEKVACLNSPPRAA